MEILNFQDSIDGKTLGTFDVYIPAGWFVGLPNYKVTENGAEKWVPYYSFSAEKSKEFQNEVTKLLVPYVK
jgi:hypothetical protein